MEATKIIHEFDALRMRNDLISSEFNKTFLTKSVAEGGWGKYIEPNNSLTLDMHLQMQEDLKTLLALLKPMDLEDRRGFVDSCFYDLPLYWDDGNEDLEKKDCVYLARFPDISSMFKNLISYIKESNLDMQREKG